MYLGEGNGTPLQYSCLENPMDGWAWWAAVHGVAKSRTRLSDFTFTSHFHALEKEMTTYSSVLVWRIPEKGEPGGLPSMGSHRVGHDWSDLAKATTLVSPLFQFLFPFRLLQNTEQSPLCDTIGPCWLSILNISTHRFIEWSDDIITDSLPTPDLSVFMVVHATLHKIKKECDCLKKLLCWC